MSVMSVMSVMSPLKLNLDRYYYKTVLQCFKLLATL